MIARDGTETWRYVSTSGGDHPTIAALEAAARQATETAA
jgi:hypothetical protein